MDPSMVAGRRLLAAAAVVGLALNACAVQAQNYPDRLIRVVVPYPAGGPIDVTARIVAHHLALRLGQTIIIENRGGAGGALGSKIAAGADPDGYTLLFGNASTLAVGPAVNRFRDYDTLKNFAPIAKVTEGYEVLVVAPEFPARNVRELVAYAKANPGKVNFGSVGYGNLTHLALELFRLKTAIDVVHVPYKGSADAITGLIGGQVQMMFGEVAGLLPLVREGKLRALAVASETRNRLAPEIPTMSEEGIADFIALTFTGVVAPAGTSPAIVTRLNGAINESLRQAEVMDALGKLGAEVRPDSPQEFAAFLARERDKWVEVVRLAGVKNE